MTLKTAARKLERMARRGVLLIRHGETDGNRSRKLQVESTPLNDNGHEQAAKLGRRVAAQFKVHKIICSDLVSVCASARWPAAHSTRSRPATDLPVVLMMTMTMMLTLLLRCSHAAACRPAPSRPPPR